MTKYQLMDKDKILEEFKSQKELDDYLADRSMCRMYIQYGILKLNKVY